MSKQVNGLVKPYWIRVGSGGLTIRDERDVVDFFFDRQESDRVKARCGKGKGPSSKRDFELVTTNKFGSSRCPPPYWTESSLAEIERAGGLLLIPGGWPEPKAGRIWEHMVPFKPRITACDAGKAEAKTAYVYVVQEGEKPGDVAVRFGQPYDEWVTLRQANHDDPDGFTKPSADSGACTFANWKAGKRVKIPAKWADPPKASTVWRSIESVVIGSQPNPDPYKALVRLFDEVTGGVLAAPRKEDPMQTRPYIVQKGDTPGTVAGRHGVAKEDLFRANPHLTVVKDRDGERNFYQKHFQFGQRINVPVTGGGIVGEPSGQVGCGGGGCGVGYFTQTPCATCGALNAPCGCGGQIGATPRMQVAARPQVQRVARPVPTFQSPWDAKHPNWNGSQIAYWSQRIGAYIRYLTGSPTPAGSPAHSKAVDAVSHPKFEHDLQMFIRTTWASPQALVQWASSPNFTLKADQFGGWVGGVPGYWYADPNDAARATLAGIFFLFFMGPYVLGAGQVGCGKGGGVGSGTYGMAQFGGVAGFNQMVARGGQIGATPRMQVAARPQMAARPMFTVQSTWDARHPNWNGSQIAYWSQRIVAFIRNDGSRCSSDSDSHLTAIVQGFLREYPTVADFRRAFMPGSGISLRLTYTVTPQINMWFAQEKDADVAYAASLLASQRCLLTQGGSVSGAPIGQVGCGKGGGVGSGTYGMAQFGGVAGFNQMVARAARPQVQRVARPVPTMQSPWDAKHPNWNGSQIAYWSQRIEAYLKSIPASNRIGLSANWEAQINPWLRRWPDPAQFVSHYFADTRPYIAPAQVPGYWYASGSDAYVAAHAALGFAALVRLGGSVGAPASGTVGANGDACTPYGAAVTDVKPYYYIVQSDDLSNFWKIPEKFNMPTKIGTAWTWQQMRNANLDWVGGFTTVNSACVLAGLYAGAKLKVPANWLEPKPGTKTEPIGGTTTTCGAGQIEMGGQCVNLPPGVTVAIGGSCPSGTTNVSGLCIPNGGYTPPPGQACLPGTIADATTGTCKLPGGAPPPAVIPGIPPVGGVCPTGMTKHSDGLCYAPGTAPPGITPVGLTSDKKTADEGYPTWAWALLGLGGVAGVAGIAYYVKKREDKGDEVEEEIEVEGVEVAGP